MASVRGSSALSPPHGASSTRMRSDSMNAIPSQPRATVAKSGDAPSEIQLSFYLLLTRLEKLQVPGAELDQSVPAGATQASERKRKKEVLANLEAILGAFIEQKRAGPSNSQPRTWAEIFHQRMVHNRDLLTPELIDHWLELFSYFIKKGGSSSIQAGPLLAVAQELCSYLRSHRQDIDKCAYRFYSKALHCFLSIYLSILAPILVRCAFVHHVHGIPF